MGTFERDSELYTNWLLEKGVTISKVAIKDYREAHQGRGVVATEDIEEGEEIFRIPKDSNVILNVKSASLLSDKPDLNDQLTFLGQWESLILCILYEFKKLTTSNWHPYFATLPFYDPLYKSDQLIYWDEEDLASLLPSLVIQRIGKQQAESMYNEILAFAKAHIPELENFTLEEFNAVALLILSYSFDVEEGNDDENGEVEDEDDDEDEKEEISIKSMIPLADTLNADTTLHNASLIYGSKYLSMKAILNIKKGEQVYNTYSEHPNAEILRRYGYVEEIGSKFDFAEVTLNNIMSVFQGQESALSVAKRTNLNDEQEDIEEDVNLVEDAYDFYISGEILPEFIVLLQYLTSAFELSKQEDRKLQESELSRLLKKSIQLVEGGKLTNRYMENYKQVLNNRINEYGAEASRSTSPTGQIVTDSDISKRKKFAQTVLQSELRALRKCLDTSTVFADYKVIEDGKFLRAVSKKRPGNEDQSKQKKAKK